MVAGRATVGVSIGWHCGGSGACVSTGPNRESNAGRMSEGDSTVYGRASTWPVSAMVLQDPTQLVLPWHFPSVNCCPAASYRAPTV